jgi:hypothetical protein
MANNRRGITVQTKTLSITMRVTSTESAIPAIIAGIAETIKDMNGVEFIDLTIQSRKPRLRNSGPRKDSGSESN